MISTVSEHLARNIRLLRQSRGLSQQQCAKLAEIPRPTWASLESGGANPTLAVLLRIASALQISIEELIRAPIATYKVYKSESLKTKTRGGCAVRELLPKSIVGTQIERMELAPRGAMAGVPHTTGTSEFLFCEEGQVTLSVSGETLVLEEGDVVVFRGDQKHSYANRTGAKAIAYSVVAFAQV